MVETLKGIVLRETPIGEYDKIMTVLTAEHGKLSVYANGAKRLKSPLFTATQLFSYGEFTISKGKANYYLRSAELIESFYGLRETLTGVALATYIADVTADIALEDESDENLLRLVLNSLHAIATGKRSHTLIKAVFEMRAAAIAGFMPDLVACTGCGRSDLDVLYFDMANGNFRCEDCFRASSAMAEESAKRLNENEGLYPSCQLITILSPSVFAAMRYAVYSKPERMLSFELKDEALPEFASVAEKYLICHLDRHYHTLEFYAEARAEEKSMDKLLAARG